MVQKLFLGCHADPLKRRKRLRNEIRRADRNRNLSVPLVLRNPVILFGNLLGKLGNALRVFVGLGRKPEHEIKLDLIPAAFKSRCCAAQNVLGRKAFIDHISHPLRSGFRGKCDA